MVDILPFPEWRPDLTPYAKAGAETIANVVPRGDGYGPIKAFGALTAALASTCRGYFFARNTDGSVTVFAGTSTRLYKLNNTDLTWVPVSKVTALTSISNASPAVFTLASHGLVANDALVLSTDGTLPTGLTVGTVYYVLSAGLTSDEFRVSTTQGGSAVNTSSAGSGTHSMTYLYATLPSTHHWQFAQFGSLVIAVKPSTAPQVFTLNSSTAFGDLGGSPPQAAYIAVVGRFVVLSGLTSNPFRIAWSGLGSATSWTAGTASSDMQDLPDGGIVRGVAGGEYGIIFQESTMRRMIYAPGSTVVFNIEKIADDKGLLAPYSIIRAGERVFWLSGQGFHMMHPTGVPEPIGKERFDRTFFNTYDSGNLQLVIGAADPAETRVYWAYKVGSGTTFDRILVYDYGLGRAAVINQSGEYMASLAAPGITLESLDSISSSIDALTFSLDDISTAALAKLSIVDSNHKIGFFSGSNMEATLETTEQGGDRRLRVKGFRPVTDAATCYGSVGTRENLQSTVSYSDEQAVNGKGLCPANVSTRLARGRLRIPSAIVWSFASGVEPEVAPEGKR